MITVLHVITSLGTGEAGQIVQWLARYGLEVRVSDASPYWVALAGRPDPAPGGEG